MSTKKRSNDFSLDVVQLPPHPFRYTKVQGDEAKSFLSLEASGVSSILLEKSSQNLYLSFFTSLLYYRSAAL